MTLGSARFRRWLVDIAVRIFPGQSPRRMLHIADTFDTTAKSIYFEQLAAFDPDVEDKHANIMQLLRELCSLVVALHTQMYVVRANAQSDQQDRLTENEVTAQMS